MFLTSLSMVKFPMTSPLKLFSHLLALLFFFLNFTFLVTIALLLSFLYTRWSSLQVFVVSVSVTRIMLTLFGGAW